MQVVLQRVTEASVSVGGTTIASIGRGVLLLHCVERGDTEEGARWLAAKVAALRIFDDDAGKPHMRSLLDVGGAALAISQFTLAGKTDNGTRPDYGAAAQRPEAEPLYERFVALLREAGVARVEQGSFGAEMRVALVNDGPLTLILRR